MFHTPNLHHAWLDLGVPVLSPQWVQGRRAWGMWAGKEGEPGLGGEGLLKWEMRAVGCRGEGEGQSVLFSHCGRACGLPGGGHLGLRGLIKTRWTPEARRRGRSFSSRTCCVLCERPPGEGVKRGEARRKLLG